MSSRSSSRSFSTLALDFFLGMSDFEAFLLSSGSSTPSGASCSSLASSINLSNSSSVYSFGNEAIISSSQVSSASAICFFIALFVVQRAGSSLSIIENEILPFEASSALRIISTAEFSKSLKSTPSSSNCLQRSLYLKLVIERYLNFPSSIFRNDFFEPS